MQITPQATAKVTSVDENNAKLVAAMRAKEQREQGLRGQAKREGREEREREILQQAGVAAIDEISMLAQIRAEHDAEKRQIELRWFREEQKHGGGKWWQGYAFGLVCGVPASAAIILLMQGVIWDTAARNFREQAMTGAVLSAGQEQRQVEQRAVAPAPSEPSASITQP